jgi:phosphotransferase system enzyme I (PtsI)
MRLLAGIGASKGIALEQILYLAPETFELRHASAAAPDAERARLNEATARANADLEALRQRMLQQDASLAAIFEVHQMMLSDPDFTEGIERQIAQGSSAEWAVRSAADALIRQLNGLDDPYFRARAADVEDIAARVLRLLGAGADSAGELTRPSVIVAEDLLPSQTMRFDRALVRGFVTRYGSTASHAAILARAMGIPCVVGLKDGYAAIPQTGFIALDGASGEVVVEPDEPTHRTFLARRDALQRQNEDSLRYRDLLAVTHDGRRMHVCANIGSPKEAAFALENGAEGVGLFRSEFLYLEGTDFPTEEAQFEAYRSVLEAFSPKPVIIRTLDLGSDKQADYFQIGSEENPALGYRSIRISLQEPALFRTQLRALLRASAYGNLGIMFPLISHPDQVTQIRSILEDVKRELRGENQSVSSEIMIGVMIETPAAALLSTELAEMVDFFSIGTNDLTQYTLAVDRTNPHVCNLFDYAHPAVKRLIAMTAEAAHRRGIPVHICGESAADVRLTEFYLSVGIDELSVSPSCIAEVKRAVIEL